MSRKNTLKHQLLNAEDLSADFESNPFNVRFLDNVGITIDASTTDINGQFYVQGTIDGESWFDLDVKADDGSTLTLASANKKYAINMTQVPYEQLRIRFDITNAGVDGQADVWVMAKLL